MKDAPRSGSLELQHFDMAAPAVVLILVKPERAVLLSRLTQV